MNKITLKLEPKIQKLPQKKRVAGYTRVSDSKEAMLHSLSAQVSYYSNLIQNNPEWLYAGVYVDKAFTGTKDDRPEFQRLIRDCKDGKIDMVICKSITRFARNTVDTLVVTRELKEIGIDVYFELERIHSISEDGELMLSILASYAQEESRVVSENCKWRLRKKFKEGVPNTFKVYGFSTKKGVITVIPEEAEIVKMIFKDYLDGMGITAIAKKLNKLKIKSMFGTVWRQSVIERILKNEKYIGDMLLQKSYIRDYLSKKQVKNDGVLPKYYIENNHEPIVSRELFEKVQNETKKRSKKSSKIKRKHLFTGLIKCSICGSLYKHKTNNSGTKYAKSVWICNTFNSLGKSYCASKQIPENILKEKLSETADISEIKQILVPKQGTIIFCLKNGQEIKKTWQNKSRGKSRLPEIKKSGGDGIMQTAAQKIITVIPAVKNQFTNLELNVIRRKKVAGYGRVSSDTDEQLNSYEAQIDYYTKHIKSKPDWEFVKVYADEGTTGLNTKRREEFNDMIDDAMSGKIDLILTKSVARFARNTVDTLVNVRKLKEKGIEVFFEQEGISSLDSKSELLLTIMSSVAQEESRKISANVTWGIRRSFENGKVTMPYKSFLGYKKDEETGLPAIVEKEANIVKLIYKLFLEGKSPSAVAKILTNKKIPTPTQKSKWYQSTVQSILTNEKYRGDALLQKCYVVDFLSKKRKKNEGEVQQYYVKNSHPAIIEPEIFEAVQNEIAARGAMNRGHSSIHIFAGKIICGDCGSYFGSKLWHSTDKYRRRIWQCNKKFKNKIKCKTPHLKEEEIKEIFIKAFNKLMLDKSGVIAECREVLDELYDIYEIELKISKLIEEKNKIEDDAKKLVLKNANVALNQDTYNAEYNRFFNKFETVKQKISELKNQKSIQITKRCQTETFLKKVNENDKFLTEFNEELWFSLVKNITVKSDGEAIVVFKNGAKIEVSF